MQVENITERCGRAAWFDWRCQERWEHCVYVCVCQSVGVYVCVCVCVCVCVGVRAWRREVSC